MVWEDLRWFISNWTNFSGVETVDLDEPSEPIEETDDQLSNIDPSYKEGHTALPEQAIGGELSSLSGAQQRRASAASQ